ncbi:MAG: thioredoxin [Firmicutes bacterium]|nr:thioredoxin [Bacillota bacterium]
MTKYEGKTIEVNSETFESEVINSPLPVVVDFWGPQCGPCLGLMPLVEELAQRYAGQVKIVKFDTSKNRRFCIGLKVMSLPTFLFFKEGKEVERLIGNDLNIGKIEASLRKVIQN